MTELAELYLQLGSAGFIALMFGFVLYNLEKDIAEINPENINNEIPFEFSDVQSMVYDNFNRQIYIYTRHQLYNTYKCLSLNLMEFFSNFWVPIFRIYGRYKFEMLI